MRRTVAIGFGVLVWLMLTAAPSGAHALVRSSDPPDGAVLDTAPKEVTITFTEPPDPALSFIHVLDQGGSEVETGEAEVVPGRRTELRVSLRSLPLGAYTVTWRVVSRTDGHVTAGSFSFGVGLAPAAVQGETGSSAGAAPPPSPLDAAGRWMLYWGLALLLSAAVVGLVAFDARLPGPGAWLVASWVLSAAGLVVMTVAERSRVGVSLGELLRSGTGQELVRQGIGLAVGAEAVAVALARRSRTTLLALAATAAGIMFLHAQAGHAAAAESAVSRWFDTSVQWLHLVGVGVWVGGLVWLLVGTHGRTGEERAPAVSRFSWLAGLAVATVAVTGVLRAIDEVGGIGAWGRLVSTSFGVTLLVKTGIFVALIALGARNRYVHVPGLASGTSRLSSLRRAVGAEVVLAAGILGATGVLTQLPPAATLAAASGGKPPAQVVAGGHDFATTTRVRLVARPGMVGPNQFRVTVLDYDTGKPVPATSVALRFTLPDRPEVESTLSLSKEPEGLWTGRGTALSIDARWTITVLVQQPAGAVEVPLTLRTRPPPVKVSKVPGQPTLYTAPLSGGGELQMYVDPGSPGPNTVHFTFFTGAGQELPIESATGERTGPEGASSMGLLRFSSGHFVANQDLEDGTYRFTIDAAARDGRALSGSFSQTIGG